MKQKMIYSLVVVLMMAMHVNVFAQQVDKRPGKCPYTPEQRMEIQTQQVVKSLMLDDATSQKFVPIYTNYLNDIHNVATERPFKWDKETCKNLSDEQIMQMIEFRFDMSQKILDLRKKYYGEFKQILTPRQIMKVYGTEKHNMERMKAVCGYKRNAKYHHGSQHCTPVDKYDHECR